VYGRASASYASCVYGRTTRFTPRWWAFEGGAAILTPFGDITGLSIDAEVIATRRRFAVPTGGALLGRVLDGFAIPWMAVGR